MKFDVTKFALSTAITTTILSTIKYFFYFFTNQFDSVIQKTAYFIPQKPAAATIPISYPFGLSIFGILILFFLAFIAAWIFASIYNKLTTAK